MSHRHVESVGFGDFCALLGCLVFVQARIWIEVGVFLLEVQPGADSALLQGSVKRGVDWETPRWGGLPAAAGTLSSMRCFSPCKGGMMGFFFFLSF